MDILFKATIPLAALLISFSLHARDIYGVTLPEQIELDGKQLPLNGAGVRSKLIFDLYVGALYLPQKTHDVQQAINMAGPKRVLMHFLYDQVDNQKLTDGWWMEGFENNLSSKSFAALKVQLEEFDELFITIKNGDQVLLDYIPGTGTQVIINQQNKGNVPGEDFNRALLNVWLGDDPADEDLKEAMLGSEGQCESC